MTENDTSESLNKRIEDLRSEVSIMSFQLVFRELQYKAFFVVIVFFGFLFVLNFVLFPFYVYLYKMNRNRDKDTPIFPIVNHFYNMMKFYFLTFLSVVVSILWIRFFADWNQYFIAIAWVITIICLFLSVIITQLFHLSISGLAIQRFILYFWPNLENYVTFSFGTVKKITWILFVLIGAKDLFGLGHMAYCSQANCSKASTELYQTVYVSIYCGLNAMILITSVLYIPILIDIRKYAHLPVAKENNPQLYIFCQAIITLVLKSLYHPIFILYVSNGFDSFDFALHALPIDMIAVPLIIQTSYIYCNQRNVNAMWKNFKMRKFLKFLFNIEDVSAVQPHAIPRLTTQ